MPGLPKGGAGAHLISLAAIGLAICSVLCIPSSIIGAFLRSQLGNLSRLVSIGRIRKRLAVTAKIAFVTAGLTAAVGASPMPPGSSVLLIKCVSTTGASLIRIGR